MHDTIKLESLRIPAVAVATREFRTAARAQAAQLGRPDFDAVYVDHPIQDQTLGEIESRADRALAEIVDRLRMGRRGRADLLVRRRPPGCRPPRT